MFERKPKHVDIDKLLEMTNVDEMVFSPLKKENIIVNMVEEVSETKLKPSIIQPLVENKDEIIWLS